MIGNILNSIIPSKKTDPIDGPLGQLKSNAVNYKALHHEFRTHLADALVLIATQIEIEEENHIEVDEKRRTEIVEAVAKNMVGECDQPGGMLRDLSEMQKEAFKTFFPPILKALDQFGQIKNNDNRVEIKDISSKYEFFVDRAIQGDVMLTYKEVAEKTLPYDLMTIQYVPLPKMMNVEEPLMEQLQQSDALTTTVVVDEMFYREQVQYDPLQLLQQQLLQQQLLQQQALQQQLLEQQVQQFPQQQFHSAYSSVPTFNISQPDFFPTYPITQPSQFAGSGQLGIPLSQQYPASNPFANPFLRQQYGSNDRGRYGV